MLRATLSNGFRAPTAGQMHSERTSHGLNADFNGVSTSGRLSPLSPVAQVLSQRPGVTITPLKPERSVNISAGIGLKNAQGATLNLDWYHIALSDRFSTTPVYELTQAEQARLAQPQYQLNYPVDTVNFFQNLFDTRTDGIDLVGHLPIAFCNQTLGLSGALNVRKENQWRSGHRHWCGAWRRIRYGSGQSGSRSGPARGFWRGVQRHRRLFI